MRYYEDETTELKQIVIEDIKKEIIAFANTKGGTIYIGVADDGSVVGIEDPDYAIQQITNMVRDAIKPDVTMFVSYSIIEEESNKLVKIDVQQGTVKPYYLAKKGLKSEGVFVRQGTSSVQASDNAIRSMIRDTDGYVYEDIRSFNQELTFEAASKEFSLRNVAFGDAQKRSLGLVNDDGIYTNLGLLLSDQCPATIKVAVFQDCTPLVFRDRKEFAGSLMQQMNEAYAYIDYHNQLGATIEGLYRIDQRDYPPVAVREAFLNALVHRDYGYSASIIVGMYEDRLEIISVGGLLPGMNLDDIMDGVSACRNTKLANVFYRLELIEAYGTGLFKIMNAYKDLSFKPEIRANNNSFKIILPNINYNNRKLKAEQKLVVSEKSYHNSYGNEDRLIMYVKQHGSITRKEIEELLKIPPATAVRLIKKLLDKNDLVKLGNGKNTYYVYRNR